MTEEQIMEELDLTKDELEKTKKMSTEPFLAVPNPESEDKPGEAVICEIVSSETKKMMTRYGQKPYIEVKKMSGQVCRLLLGSKIMRMQYGKLLLKYGKEKLTGKKIAVWKAYYTHKDYGLTVGCNIQVVQDDEVQEISSSTDNNIVDDEIDTITADQREEQTNVNESERREREDAKAFM